MAIASQAYNALMGMFSPKNPQNVSGSIYDMARRDAQNQALARIGGGLMAAAVPQTPLMRAQALQGAFGGMGDVGTGIYNAAQARLMAQKTEREQRMMQQRDAMFASDTPPEGINADQWAKLKMLYSYDPDGASSAFGKILAGNTGADFIGSKTPQYVQDTETGEISIGFVDPIKGFIPVQTPEGKKFVTPEELAYQKAYGGKKGSTTAEQISAAPSDVISKSNTLTTINKIRNADPDLINSIVGAFVGQFDNPAILEASGYLLAQKPGASGLAADIAQLASQRFVEGIKEVDLKGALSNLEGDRLSAAQTNLTRARDVPSFLDALDNFYGIVETSMRRKQWMAENNASLADGLKAIPPYQHTPNQQAQSPSTTQAAPQAQPQTMGIPANLPQEVQDVWPYLSDEDKKLFMGGQ